MVRILQHAGILVVYSQNGPDHHVLENHMKLCNESDFSKHSVD